MSPKFVKKVAKKATTKAAVSSRRIPHAALHDRLIKLLQRPEGATMHDTWNIGYYYPAMSALKIAERRGFKTRVNKRPGELTRYYAKRR